MSAADDQVAELSAQLEHAREQLARAADVERQLADARARAEEENTRLTRDVAMLEAIREAAVPALEAARAENTHLRSWLTAARAERDELAEKLGEPFASDARAKYRDENTRLSADLVESRKLGLRENTELGDARRRLYALENEMGRLGCDCIATYPQLQEGKLNHGPGCRLAASDKSAIRQLRRGGQ